MPSKKSSLSDSGKEFFSTEHRRQCFIFYSAEEKELAKWLLSF